MLKCYCKKLNGTIVQKEEKKMKKFILGMTTLMTISAFAAGPATGTSLTPSTTTFTAANKIDNTVKIAGDAKSINYLSVMYGNRGAGQYSPTGETAITQEIYTDVAASTLTNVKVVTTNYEADDTDFDSLAALAANETAKDLSAPGARTDYTVSYDNSFDSNAPYFQYVLDMNNRKVYKTYFADGTRASYRVIKTSDIDTKTITEIKSPNFVPSGGYVTDRQLPIYAAKGEIKESQNTDPNSDAFYTDNANYAVSGDTVYKYLKNWENTSGIGALNDRMNKAEKGIKEAKAGVALGVAMANIPDNFREGDLNNFGVGVGYYAGHSAVALGYQRRFSDNAFVWKTTVGFNTAGSFAVGTGATYSW